MTLQVHMIPEGQFQNKDLEILLNELSEILKAKEVMCRDEAAAFLSISTRTLDRLSISGALPSHQIKGLSKRLYLRSEIIQYIKMQK